MILRRRRLLDMIFGKEDEKHENDLIPEEEMPEPVKNYARFIARFTGLSYEEALKTDVVQNYARKYLGK